MTGTWIAVGLTLAALSLVAGESALSRLAESVFVGASVGYSLSVLLFDLVLPRWDAGTLLLPALLTGALCFRHLRPWILAALAGYAAGVTLPRIVETHVLRQLEGSAPGIALVATLAVLWRFRQTGEPGPVSRGFGKIGSLFLMVYLGAAFGNAVQGRLAVLQGRIAELAANGYATAVLSVLAILVVWKTRKPE